MTLLEVRGLSKAFAIRSGAFKRQWARVVDDVSFVLNSGETLGLVGESGCGKTTLARCILRITEPTSGEIVFDGKDLAKLDSRALRASRSELAIVYQNPYLSLSPRLSVHDLVAEPLVTHSPLRGEALTRRVVELLEAVGLSSDDLRKRARQLSGGQAQRVAIARALALRPKLIVLDEPTSALDVSVQAQVLNLLVKLQREYGLTYLFISHNLDVVQHMADRLLVMYLGRVAEMGPTVNVFRAPQHPYTLALLAATPEPDPDRPAPAITLEGNVPSPLTPPPGCRFHPRCPWAQERCKVETPALRQMADGHVSACHFAETLPAPASSSL